MKKLTKQVIIDYLEKKLEEINNIETKNAESTRLVIMQLNFINDIIEYINTNFND